MYLLLLKDEIADTGKQFVDNKGTNKYYIYLQKLYIYYQIIILYVQYTNALYHFISSPKKK